MKKGCGPGIWLKWIVVCICRYSDERITRSSVKNPNQPSPTIAEVDPLRGNQAQASGVDSLHMEKKVAEDRWIKAGGQWVRASVDKGCLVIPDKSSKEVNTYKAPITDTFLPNEVRNNLPSPLSYSL